MSPPEDQGKIALRFEGVSKDFHPAGRWVQALDQVGFSVRHGRVTGLVGPDGGGKTTLLRLAAGLLLPASGHIDVLGINVIDQPLLVQQSIGYMPQRFGLYDDLTVAENIAFYADIYRVPKTVRQTRVPELLAFSNLDPFQKRLAANLSGGMRQKLGLVCALIHTPRLLILDEPTFGVDPVSRREFWQILYNLLGTGMTIFLSTAYMDEAERAHRVGLMHRGRLLVADTPGAIKATFAGELLEVRAEDLRGARKILSPLPEVRQVLAMGDRLMVTVARKEEALAPLTAALKDGGIEGVRIVPAEPALEELFVQIVRREEE